MKIRKQILTVGTALSLVLAVGACGDDDPVPAADARPAADGGVDATPPIDGAPDATPAAVRGGLIGVLQVSVTNNLGPLTVSGGAVTVGLSDPTDPLETSTVIFNVGDTTNGCTVRQYIVGAGNDGPNPDLNEGTISLGGDISPAGAFPDCIFSATSGAYSCPSLASGTPGAGMITIDHTIVDAATQFTDITVAGASFDPATQREVGMYIGISGLPDSTTGAGAMNINNGNFGIIGVMSATTVRVLNTTWLGCVGLGGGVCDGAAQDQASVAGGWGVVAGAGPLAGGFGLYTLKNNKAGLCNDGTTACTIGTEAADCTGQTPATCTVSPVELTITKTADPTGDEVLPAFSTTVKPSGEGFALDSTSAQPEAMPTATDSGVTVSCNGDGDCGITGEIVTGFVVSGTSTDTATAAGNPIDFPDATTSYTTLFCTFIGLETATIPVEAWAAFLKPGVGGNPGVTQTYTRFETQILRLGAKLGSIPGHGVLMGAGYGLVGYTDAP